MSALWPRSLRRYLLAGIVIPITVFVIADTVGSYHRALEAIHTAYDRSLLASARSIGELLQPVGSELKVDVPYAALENYDRMKSAMRLYRALPDDNASKKFLAQDIAFYMGWLGHYTADGAQPLHDTIHHDGWLGPNPKNYTRDPRIHGRFESQFVDLIQLTEADLKPATPQLIDDPFAAFVAHLDDAYTHVEEVYQLDNAGAFADKDSKPAKALAVRQLTRAAALLRDLVYTAWVESGKPASRSATPEGNPILSTHPRYNPETGTAPPAPGLPTRP